VVVLKDQVNKELHEHSAQVACEAAASIRTVASLVREEDCTRAFSKSLDEALQRSNRSMIPRVAMFALSQAASFWVISLVRCSHLLEYFILKQPTDLLVRFASRRLARVQHYILFRRLDGASSDTFYHHLISMSICRARLSAP